MPIRFLIAIVLCLQGITVSSAVSVPLPYTIRAQVSRAQTAESTAPHSRYAAVLNRYCVTCHNGRMRVANLALDEIQLDAVGTSAAILEKVARKLRLREMPPAGRPRPDEATYEGFATWLEAALDREAAATPNPGRPSIHRLNRTEYTTAIFDLLAFPFDGRAWLPVDDTVFGFDNNADLLAVQPGLLERYMSAARRISRLAIGDLALRPLAETYQISELVVQDDRLSEDLPFGTRGGIAFRHYFPLDGDYVLRVRLQRDKAGAGTIRGIAAGSQQLDVHLNRQRLKRFTVGDPGSARPGQPADAGLEVRFAAHAGSSVVGVSMLKQTVEPEGVVPTRLPVWTFSVGNERISIDNVQIEGPFNPLGAGDTPSRQRIFVCHPEGGKRSVGFIAGLPRVDDESACAREIISTLARRAYRRPVVERDVEKLLRFYVTGYREAGFEAGIRAALEAILVDPEFLFRIERDPRGIAPATAYRLSGLEVASRLSFFLWSSLPDDELIALADRGALSDPAVLEAQVRRMLADRRSDALVENFGEQWLQIRRLQGATPDVNAFPEFDDNLRQAFQRETRLFFESQLREDHPVTDLLTANYTYVNERLARHYAIPNVYGSRFRRVTLPKGERQGLLGQGSILTVTSHAHRTSPVLRGKWVLETILGAPPPPPPANVPPLEENKQGERPTSVRERLEAHRSNPVCASCHARMDPIGFALENFDAIGKWRDVEGAARIDPTAALTDGTKFRGAAGLRTWLASRQDDFVRAVTEKLLTYALGRGVEYYDQPTIRGLMKTTKAADLRWSAMIANIVQSTPFQMRRSEP